LRCLKVIAGKPWRNKMPEKKNVQAYRGYYVPMDLLIPLIVQLLEDSKTRRHGLIVLGNEERAKLEGATMSLLALKEATFRMEVFGDLIPLQEPPTKKEREEDVSKIIGEDGNPLQKEERIGPA
jgi:hypothetical protein